MDGILVLYKEKNMTSFDCIFKLRKILGEKKIGHTGTLDPMVEGVMVICLGKATKLVELLMDHTKEYEATCLLGVKTDTEDCTGKILEEKEVPMLTLSQIDEVLQSFSIYYQTPPMYSAIKVNGQRLYDLARKNKEVERQARLVEIKQITRLSDYENYEFQFKVSSGKGLYVRTLCCDIAQKLGTIGTMKSLIRTKLGAFSLDDAYTLEDIAKGNYKLYSIDEALDTFPKIEVKEYLVRLIKNGITLDNRQTDINEPFTCVYNNEILALYKPVGEGKYKPVLIKGE